MGFPSPATDYIEHRVSLDRIAQLDPNATYYMRAGTSYPSVGILKGSVLVIDSSLSPKHGCLLVAAINGELCIKRYVRMPEPGLQCLKNEHDVTKVRELEEMMGDASPIWGVIAYVLIDAFGHGFNPAPGI